MSKILVTGGAGYIGSMLVPALLWKGHDVTVYDNFMYHQTPFNDFLMREDLEIVKGDVTEYDKFFKFAKKADYLIPLAALVGMPLCKERPHEALQINHLAIRMIARAIRDENLDTRIIIPITNSGYGIGEKGVECTEESPLNPLSDYGQTKVDAEKAVFEFLGSQSISLRLATVFGASPRMRLDLLVNEFVYRAVHDRAITLFEADFMRNYLHVRDVANAFCFAIDNFDKMKGQVYNVGDTDANMSKRQLCERIKLQLPEFVFTEAETGTDPDKRDYIVSNAKIEKMGFYTQISLDRGIAELITLYKHMKIPNPYGNV